MPTDRISKLLEDIRFLDQARFELVQVLKKTILDLISRFPGKWRAQASYVGTSNSQQCKT